MSSKKIVSIFMGVIALIIVIACLASIYRVDEGEEALVLTFGELTDRKDAGLYWHVPIIQDVQTQSLTEKYTLEYGFRTSSSATTTSGAQYNEVVSEAIMLTSDLNIVSVEAIYQVVVNDAATFFYEVDEPFETLQFAFETVLRRNVQNRTLDDALLNKKVIQDQVLPDFRELINQYNLGVYVEQVLIQNIVVPSEVSSAYQDVINAHNEQLQKIDEAEKYRYEVVPIAEAEAHSMIQKASAQQVETIAKAKGEVAVFNAIYEKYKLSPEITRTRLFIETIEKIMENASQKYIIEDSGDGILKFLPIGADNSRSVTENTTGGE